MKKAFLKKLSLEDINIDIKPNSLLDAFSGQYSHIGYDKHAFADKIADQLINTLNLFRNKISPLKKEIVNEVSAKLSFDQTNIKYVNISIIDIITSFKDYLDYIRSNVLENDYLNHENVKYSFNGDLISFINVDELSEEDIKNCFLTGNKELDYITVISLNKFNIEELKNLIKDLSIIPGQYPTRKVFNDYIQLIDDFLINYDRVILTLSFLVRSILNPFRVNLDIEKSKTVKNRLTEHFIYALEDCYKRYLSFVEGKVLVISSKKSTYENLVYVLKPSFSEYLEQCQEEENAIDAVLGCINYGDRYEIKDIIDRKDSFTKSYRDFVSEQVIVNHNKKVSSIKSYILNAFEKQLKLMPNEDLRVISGKDNRTEELVDQVEVDIDNILKDIREYINNKQDRQLLEVDNVITEILGDVIYKDPIFIKFATELRNVMEEYKVITIQEACYIVCVNLIIDKYITSDLLK